jgi:hypothetical protein
MKVFPLTAARRIAAVAAAAVAGLAISTAAYAATTSSSAPAHLIPRCTANDLGVWVALDQGNGAAGTIYYPLEFTNLSDHTCYLYGYPGVSALNADGNQLGSSAGWGSLAGARIVNVAPGATAHTILAYHDVAVAPGPGCGQVKSATVLRVYAPGQRSSNQAGFPAPACSARGVIYLGVTEPIIPGVGTING